MSAFFTPGPWVARKWAAQESGIVARIDGKDTLVTGYALDADAKLIAAAPDLLSRLSGLVQKLDTADSESVVDVLGEDGWLLVREAKIAIAKALGQ